MILKFKPCQVPKREIYLFKRVRKGGRGKHAFLFIFCVAPLSPFCFAKIQSQEKFSFLFQKNLARAKFKKM